MVFPALTRLCTLDKKNDKIVQERLMVLFNFAKCLITQGIIHFPICMYLFRVKHEKLD